MKYVLLVGVLLIATPVSADVPAPNPSTVDPCLIFCPAGDITFNVIVRGTTGQPIQGAWVDVEYTGCPGFALCAPTGGEPYSHVSGPGMDVVRVTSDAQGHAAFPVRAGGSCAANAVNIRADGVLLARRALASPDQNGDGLVATQDVALLQSKIGSQDPTGDLDCDGSVTGSDLALLQSHSGHACELPTPSAPDTWGRIKTLYR